MVMKMLLLMLAMMTMMLKIMIRMRMMMMSHLFQALHQAHLSQPSIISSLFLSASSFAIFSPTFNEVDDVEKQETIFFLTRLLAPA